MANWRLGTSNYPIQQAPHIHIPPKFSTVCQIFRATTQQFTQNLLNHAHLSQFCMFLSCKQWAQRRKCNVEQRENNVLFKRHRKTMCKLAWEKSEERDEGTRWLAWLHLSCASKTQPCSATPTTCCSAQTHFAVFFSDNWHSVLPGSETSSEQLLNTTENGEPVGLLTHSHEKAEIPRWMTTYGRMQHVHDINKATKAEQ